MICHPREGGNLGQTLIPLDSVRLQTDKELFIRLDPRLREDDKLIIVVNKQDLISMHQAEVVLAEHFSFVESTLSYLCDTDEYQIGDTVLVPFGKKYIEGLIIQISEVESVQSNIKPIAKKLPYKLPIQCIEVAKRMSDYYFAPLALCIRLFLPRAIWQGKSQEKLQNFWELNTSIPLEESVKRLGKKQQAILDVLQEYKELEQSKLLELTDTDTSTLKRLEERNIIIKTEKEIQPQPFVIQKEALKSLTSDQEKALEALKSHSYSLLQGITGSGKTEVFLHFFKWIFEQDSQNQCLFMVPEIALTPQMISYFSKAFPARIGVVHSQMNERERCEVWRSVENGETRLVIGSRSALFLPWKQLSAIVMDEEHEWTYKSDQAPRYNSKKVAEWLLSNIKYQISNINSGNNLESKISHLKFLILSSATPDICHRYAADQKEIQLVKLSDRIHGELPKVTIVDMRQEFLRKNTSPLSLELQHRLAKVLKDGKQAILFLNKRGYSKSVQCYACGHIMSCPHCDIPFTHHINDTHTKEKLICHYCFLMKDMPNTCPDCDSPSIKFQGYGTQRIEHEIQRFFPHARILRADRDTTSRKGSFEDLYESMKENRADILLGTQMISKGLDLPNVALVGIIHAESGLHVPDFRSSEKVFQLLTQVAGRSGRQGNGEVILQTFTPHHEVIQAASLHNYEVMYQQTIEERKLLKYPPFSEVIKLTFVHADKKVCMQKSEDLKKKLLLINHSSLIITSAPSFIPKKSGKYYWNVLIRGEKVRDVFKTLPKELLSGWRIDRDPVFLS